MSEIETGDITEATADLATRQESIWNLPVEVIERIPLACISCSAARLRALHGNFSRECPAPILEIMPELEEDTVRLGEVAVRQFCQYPTGPEAKETQANTVKLSLVETPDGRKIIQVGENGPFRYTSAPTRPTDRDWTPERLKALLYVIDHQNDEFTHGHIWRQTNPGKSYTPNAGMNIRFWLRDLKTASRKSIIHDYKDGGVWVMYVPEDFYLEADETLRAAVAALYHHKK